MLIVFEISRLSIFSSAFILNETKSPIKIRTVFSLILFSLLFKKANHIQQISGQILGRELSKHHVYLSASINEPAGMHHIEGAICGLPIIYRKSGALPEYCNNFGIEFQNKEFLPALKRMLVEYPKYKENITKYANNS